MSFLVDTQGRQLRRPFFPLSTAILTMNLTLCLADERILYEAIYRHVEHLAGLNWVSYDENVSSSDSILAAQMAVEMFPTLGYPVPHWITELAQS
jgi:hypothetical protein